MERWRTFFGKAGADIWTIIEQAIILAAADYPKDFKEKRSEIAETLFARRLLQLHPGDTDVTWLSGSVVTNATNLMEENEVRNDEEEEAEGATGVAGSEVERHRCGYDEAEALNDEMEEETLLMKELYRIKETIMDSDQSENTIFESLQRLEYLQITFEALKASEMGKQVNSLRKHSSKRVRVFAKRLVRGWKDLVDEWVESAGDVAAAAIAGSGGGGISEAGNEEQGLPSPPLDEGALLAARTTSLEMSQLFSFMDDEICVGSGQANTKDEEHLNSVEPPIEDNLYFPSKSQSGSMLTDCSDCDAKASTSHNWGFRVPEERGSSTRVDFDCLGRIERKPESSSRGSTCQSGNDHKEMDHLGRFSVTKSVTGSSGPGRPSNDMTKVRGGATAGSSGPVPGRSANEISKMKRSHDLQRNAEADLSCGDKSSKPSTLNKSAFTDKTQVAQRLEITKRKLHEGYQQAENAKKQRTVQLVDLPDLPKAVPNRGKVNPPVQNKAGSQNGHWNQNRRYG